MFDWDDLRLFLAVARARRLAAAARALGIDATTVARRLARLAEALDAPLFETAGGERRLTPRGEALLAHAERVEREALAVVGEVGGEASRLAGQVRLSVAEGFASAILAPALPAFHLAHPEIRIDLVTASGFLNPSKREADMAVMLARPRRGRLIASKLGDYRLRLYATPAYLAARGVPALPSELARHALVGYVPEFLYTPELDYLDEVSFGLEPAIRSTSINVQHQLLAHGAGIGVLPAFLAARDPRLVTVLPQVEVRRTYWLVVHDDLRRLARIEAVGRWIKERAGELG